MLDIYGIGALSSTEKTGNSIVPLSNTNLSLVSTKYDRWVYVILIIGVLVDAMVGKIVDLHTQINLVHVNSSIDQ